MVGFILKVIICPIVLIFADYMFGDIYYANYYQAVVTGLIIAVIGHVMELMVLRRGTMWISTALDFIAAAAVVYISQFLFRGAYITVLGAVYAAVLIAATELLQHYFLNKFNMTRKSSDSDNQSTNNNSSNNNNTCQ